MTSSKWLIAIFFVGIIIVATNLGYTEYSEELTDDAAKHTHSHDEHSHSHGIASDAKADEVEKAIDQSALEPQSSDIMIGNASAPVKIVEYASLSCPHCAKFHTDTLPSLKKDYINEGKVVLVFRHFPLNAPAMRASMAVQCADKTKREAFTKHLFETQADWAFNSGYLAQIAKIAETYGLGTKAVEACFSNTAIENQILATRQTAEQKLDVGSTPVFFINGKSFHGSPNVKTMKAAIDAALTANTP